MSDLNQNHEISPIPSTSDDDDENSFVILSTCINGDYSLPPIESMTLKDIQSLVSGELSKNNAQTQHQQDVNQLGSPITSLKSIDSHEDIQKKVEELICENEKLKSTLQQDNLRMKAQKDKIILWQKEIEIFCKAHKDKLAEAKETIDRLKETNLKLSEDVAKYKDIKILQDEEILLLKQQINEKPSNDKLTDSTNDNLKEFELEMANKKIQEQQISIDELQQNNNELIEANRQLNEKATKYDSFDDYRQLEQQKNNKLRVEVLEKLQMIEEEKRTWQDEISELRMEIARLREQQNNDDSLRKEMNELKSKYDSNLIENHEQLRLQLMNAQKKITELEQELTKSKQIDQITKKFDDKKVDDEIFVLRQQLDIYKSDFDAEIQAKSLLKDENRQISEDLMNLQKRNQQLQEQVETLRLQSPASSTTTANRSTVPNAPTAAPPSGYDCPKCSFNSTNYQSLEDHIDRCLDIVD